MSIRTSAVAFALAVLAMPAALATTGTTPNTAGELSFTTHPMPSSGLTREQVRKETEIARRDGTLQRLNSDGAYYNYQGPVANSKSREQVRQELEAWRQNPVSPDGWRAVGGELGWVYEGR